MPHKANFETFIGKNFHNLFLEEFISSFFVFVFHFNLKLFFGFFYAFFIVLKFFKYYIAYTSCFRSLHFDFFFVLISILNTII